MHVHVFVYAYICVKYCYSAHVCPSVCIRPCVRFMHIYRHIYIYIYMCVFVRALLYEYMDICACVSMAHVYACMSVCTHKHLGIYTCVPVCMCACKMCPCNMCVCNMCACVCAGERRGGMYVFTCTPLHLPAYTVYPFSLLCYQCLLFYPEDSSNTKIWIPSNLLPLLLGASIDSLSLPCAVPQSNLSIYHLVISRSFLVLSWHSYEGLVKSACTIQG